MASTPLTQQQLQALIAGIPAKCPTATFYVASQTFTAPEAVTFLTSVMNAGTAVKAKRAALTAAIQAAAKADAGNGEIAKEIREGIALMFSNDPETLSVFDIAQRKPPKPLSAEARAAANAKAAATRKARGTKSKKQKVLADFHDPEGGGLVQLRAVA